MIDNWNLPKLKADADDACAAAFQAKQAGDKALDDAINWGDLGCVQAESFRTSDGDSGLRVHIEEAAPGCPGLSTFIQAFLHTRDWPKDVEVVTCW